jgi:hypothetical protein
VQSFSRFLREASANKPETLLRMPLDVTRAEELGYVPAQSIFGVIATPDEQKVAQAYADGRRRYADLPYEELEPTFLTPTQYTLLAADITKFRGGHTSGVLVLSLNGRLFIVDGHHRAAAAVMDGNSILGQVIRPT